MLTFLYASALLLLLIGRDRIADAQTIGNICYSQCDSAGVFNVTRVGVEGCADHSNFCTFVRGQDYTVVIEGYAAQGNGIAYQVPYKVYWQKLGQVDVQISNGELCSKFASYSQQQSCPVDTTANAVFATFEVVYQVPLALPVVSPFVSIVARAWRNTATTPQEALACVQFFVKLTDPGVIGK